MDILITNDDGFEAEGLAAAFEAVRDMGTVHVIAPVSERSACSHTITLRRPIAVQRVNHERFGPIHAVDGTPADCVRLSPELLDRPLDLVVSGINRGANSGVDIFYSGTIAGAREACILGIPSIAVSQSLRSGIPTDWTAASHITSLLIHELIREKLSARGFWSINLPAPIPPDARNRVHRVPVASSPAPPGYERVNLEDGRMIEFKSASGYWVREDAGPSDYTVIRDGGISVSAIPLHGRF